MPETQVTAEQRSNERSIMILSQLPSTSLGPDCTWSGQGFQSTGHLPSAPIVLIGTDRCAVLLARIGKAEITFSAGQRYGQAPPCLAAAVARGRWRIALPSAAGSALSG